MKSSFYLLLNLLKDLGAMHLLGFSFTMEANRVEEKQQPELHMPPALGPHPWLVYFHGEHGQSQTLYSMIEGSYQVKNIPEMQDMQIATCSHGWLISSSS